MKSEATESSTGRAQNDSNHAPTFAKVLDGRKQPIRGLWVRNGRYYAQLAFEDATTGEKKTRRVPLTDKDGNPVASVAEARAAMETLKVRRSDDNLPVLRRTPLFRDFVSSYLSHIKAGLEHREGRGDEDVEGTKGKRTIEREELSLDGWVKHLGGVRLDKIRPNHINGYKDARLAAGISNRTFNLDVICLRNCLRYGIEQGWINRLPTENMRPLKVKSVPRPLFTADQLHKLCEAITAKGEDGQPILAKNAEQLLDYVKFLAYTGAREQEGLRVRWEDVDFDREHVTIGAEGHTKNNTGRTVDFHPILKAHLLDMQGRYQNVSKWLFPSPQRGAQDARAKTLRESFKLAREKAKMPAIGFHDLRHFFCSYCVMSGIDFMTIAKWVGHKDGGVLIGKTYGHLADEHRKAMAAKVNFGPVLLERTA